MSIPTAKKDSFETPRKKTKRSEIRTSPSSATESFHPPGRFRDYARLQDASLPFRAQQRNPADRRALDDHVGRRRQTQPASRPQHHDLPPSSSTEKKFPTLTSNGIRRPGRSSRSTSGRSSSARTRSGIWSASTTLSSTSTPTFSRTFR